MRYLVQPQAAVLQTPEQDLILCSSRTCYFRPTRPKTYSIFKILLAIATAILLSTIQLRIRAQRQVIIPHLISGAPLAERQRMTSRSGSKTGSAVEINYPSLVCTTTSTRRLGLCSSIEPLGDARNLVAP